MLLAKILKGDRGGQVFLLLLLATLVAVPILNALPPEHSLQLPTYLVTLLGKYLTYALLAISVDLVWGFMGILSLGHAAFFGIGAYSAALLATKAGLSFWSALPVVLAVVLQGVFGLIFGQYRRRWQFGSFDEVVAIAATALSVACSFQRSIDFRNTAFASGAAGTCALSTGPMVQPRSRSSRACESLK